MTRIVEPFIQDLRQQVLKMGRMAEAIVAKSMASVFDHNASLASEVPKDDLEIYRADVIIDEMVLRALALLDLRCRCQQGELPSGGAMASVRS